MMMLGLVLDEEKFKRIAEAVEEEWGMAGLSSGLYYDYALEITNRLLRATNINITVNDNQVIEVNPV